MKSEAKHGKSSRIIREEDWSSWKPSLLLILIIIRLVNALTIRTFFQPDEYWQALEPAHRTVFGYGYETWEWKEAVRSAFHPMMFAAVYKLTFIAGYNEELLIIGPKILQAVLAGIGDYCFYILAKRLLGQETARIAVIVAVGSAFNWFCVTRTFSNSMEMIMTTIALSYWPWTPTRINWKSYSISLLIGFLSCMVRPTNALIWGFLGLNLLISARIGRWRILIVAITACSFIFAVNFVVDYRFYGEVTLPMVNFLKYNLYQSLSQFYGVSPWHYYLSQGLPILLIAYLPITIVELWRSGWCLTVRLITFILVVYSLISHKEVRFIYPLLPLLHLFTAKGIQRLTPRIKVVSVALMLFINLTVSLYFSVVHQRGVIDVISFLRHDQYVTGIGFLMPCHSTPWQSHLHRNDLEQLWFLTCEPPLDLTPIQRLGYMDEADQFYANPAAFLDSHFPSLNGSHSHIAPTKYEWPSHLVFFQHLEPVMGNYLQDTQYREVCCFNFYDFNTNIKCQRFFNSHFHDDYRRKGDVVVYCVKTSFVG